MAQNLRFACLTVLLSVASASAATVTGVVSNTETHGVLSSMVVAGYDTNGTLQGSATTDSTGRYELQLPDGSYRLLAYDPKGLFATTFGGDADSFDTSPVVPIGPQPEVVNFALRLAGRVAGSVSIVSDGPVAQATVAAYNLSGTRRGFVQTDGAGNYSIVLPPGQYKIVAYDDAGFFAPRFYPDQYGFQLAEPVNVSAGAVSQGKDVHLEIAAHIGGAVTDADTGANLAGIVVHAYEDDGVSTAQATTNANGRYAMNVPAGAYRLLAADHNLVYATGYFHDTESFEQSLAISVAVSQSRLDVDFKLHRGGALSGQAIGSEGTLPNITVAAYNSDGSKRSATQTDASGAYTLVLPGDRFRIAAYDEQLTHATQFYRLQQTFRAADTVDVVPPTAIRSLDFALIHAGRISGTIQESATGAPAFAVAVAAYDATGAEVNTTLSSAGGAYTLVLPPGNYRIVAYDSALRYATAYGGGALNYEQAAVYNVSMDQTQSLNFTVVRGMRLGGTVTDGAGRPLSGIQIGALDLAGNRTATTFATNGGFAMVLLPGSYKMLAADPSGSYSSSYYSNATTLGGATPVVLKPGTSPPQVTFVLSNGGRRRAVEH